MTSLYIEYIWNGEQIKGQNKTKIICKLLHEVSCMEIKISAPFYNDERPPNKGSTNGLWNYEVVEIFFLAKESEKYLELEFGPHGNYYILLLNGKRRIVKESLPLVNYQTNLNEHFWTGRALIPFHYFPENVDAFNAYAIHGVGEKRVYEAYKPVPGPFPDFHRLEYFLACPLELRPKVSCENSEWNS